jgi:hypothetical protein
MPSSVILFYFILSLVYLLSMTAGFLINLFSETPKPLDYDKFDKVFLLLSFSYVLTYLLT